MALQTGQDSKKLLNSLGNKAGGTRLGKAHQEINVLAEAGRTEVTELKKESK